MKTGPSPQQQDSKQSFKNTSGRFFRKIVESCWFSKPSNLSDAILTWQALGFCPPFCQGNGYKKTPCPLLELYVGVGGIERQVFASEKG